MIIPELSMTSNRLIISKKSCLFLDRDGVINRRLVDDYVKSWDEFEFIEGVPEAVKIFSQSFGRIFVVTNQQGIGKGLMTNTTLETIHGRMQEELRRAGGNIDKVYHCPGLKNDRPFCRKPQVGMGLQAKKDFPEISFRKSVMAGDSLSDMQFGKRLRMTTVLIGPDNEIARQNPRLVDFWFLDLISFANFLKKQNSTVSNDSTADTI